MKCPWCGNKIPRDLGEQKIQLGEHGFFLGDLPHLFSGALKVEILQCKKCSKLEFFALTNES